LGLLPHTVLGSAEFAVLRSAPFAVLGSAPSIADRCHEMRDDLAAWCDGRACLARAP